MVAMVGTAAAAAGGPWPGSLSAAEARASYLITVLGYLVLTRVIAIFSSQGCSEDWKRIHLKCLEQWQPQSRAPTMLAGIMQK